MAARVFDLGAYQSAAVTAASSAVLELAVGAFDEALRQVESVMRLVDAALTPIVWDLVHLERAASLLALGDVAAAVREAQRIHDEVARIGAKYLHLKADLILAEAECRARDTAAAVPRVAESGVSILSGTAY